MESIVWADPKVLSLLSKDYIVTALYVDDKTTLPEEDWYISEFDGKKRKLLVKNMLICKKQCMV